MTTTLFSTTVIDKAIALISEGAVRQDIECPEVWWVESGSSPRIYRVQTNEAHSVWTCTCEHGLHVAHVSETRCSHSVAARMVAELTS